jgi:hypothetical protein
VENEGRPIAKRHHTVPQFYLRGFADSDKIATVRLPGARRFVQSVSNAAVAKNFYSVDGHPGGADVVETGLSVIEAATASVFAKITAGTWPLEIDDQMTLGYFIALQTSRVPSRRKTIDHLASQLVRLQVGAGGKSGLRRRLEKEGREVTDELVDTLWRQATRPEGPPVERPRVEHLQQIFDTADEVLKYVVGRPWTLVQFGRRHLITSDSPVGLVRHPDDDSTASAS